VRSDADGPGHRSVRAATLLPAAGATVVGFTLAWATLLPGVAFWDTAELQTVGPLLGTAHPTGSPTWVIIGWLASNLLAPLGEPAYRMNLLNAACLGVAAGLTATLVRLLTGRAWLSFATGVLLATTPIAWSIGTQADVHGLLLVLVAFLFVLLVEWERRERSGSENADRVLVGAAIVFGLTVGTHGLVFLLLPGILLFVRAVDRGILRRRHLVATALLAMLLALALVELELPLRAGPLRAELVYGHPETWAGFWSIVLAQQFQGSLVVPFADLGTKAADLVARAAGQLGPIVWLVLPGIVVTARRRSHYALLTIPSLAIVCWFAASYENARIDRYYLIPVLIALTWIAVLADAALDRLEGAMRTAGVPRAVAAGLGALLVAVLLVPAALDLPGRWRAVDLSHERQAAAWLDAVLDERILGRDAVVLSWWSYSTPLWYAQLVEGRRPDISIVDDRTRLDEYLGDITDVIDANLGRRPVAVIQIDPAVLARLGERYRLVRLDVPGDQPVYRVEAIGTGRLVAAGRRL
jgi:hypothetical protein